MAEGGFWKRLKNLWSGFLNMWISDKEKEHPEIVYQNAIDDMTKKYVRLKEATASIIRRREDIDYRLDQKQKELAQISADLETAVEQDADDAALVLIEKKNALEDEIRELEANLEQARQDAEEAKSSLLDVQKEIEKLRAEKDRMMAQLKTADARIQIQEQLEGVSTDAEVQALENVREHIKNRQAQASLNRELGDSSLEHKLKEIRKKTGDAAAKKQLEAMKAAKAAKEQKTKTM